MITTEECEFGRRLFSVAEAADYLRVSRTMIFKLLRLGRLTPTKIGTRTLISGAAIERLLAAKVEEAMSATPVSGITTTQSEN